MLPKKFYWRLVSSMLAYGTAGFADGSEPQLFRSASWRSKLRGERHRAHLAFLSVLPAPGAILPHIEADYNLTYIQVSTLFVAATCGFLTGSLLSLSSFSISS